MSYIYASSSRVCEENEGRKVKGVGKINSLEFLFPNDGRKKKIRKLGGKSW